ncbi:hypothetical protein [Azohydromonas lata]|uniref:hypothetical protein n=1 Tax=Azohydromonas lata TaxID=45677 RepID=UPI00082EBC90|nr:hypothetical protein [Azohydromonas lata]
MTGNRRRPGPAALVAAALALGLPAARAQPQPPEALQPAADAGPLRVMTYNAGAGTAWTPLFFSVDLLTYVDAAGRVLREVRATQPHARMRALAAQVAQAAPHLVAVQALGRWSTGTLALHGLRCGPMKVEIDMLAALLQSLRALGRPYRVAVQAAQFELPPLPARPAPGELRCVQASERVVILERADLPRGATARPQRGRLDAPAPPPALAAAPGTAQVGVWPGGRAWVSVDVRLPGGALRFVSAQLARLDPFTPDERRQDGELLRALAESSPLPVALALSSTVPAAPPPPDELQADFLAAGWRDAWAQAQPAQLGATCCRAPSMDDTDPQLSRRSDVLWLRGAVQPRAARLAGAAAADRTSAGLWPSDHAGVVVELQTAPAR